jgi:hypothetical protein
MPNHKHGTLVNTGFFCRANPTEILLAAGGADLLHRGKGRGFPPEILVQSAAIPGVFKETPGPPLIRHWVKIGFGHSRKADRLCIIFGEKGELQAYFPRLCPVGLSSWYQAT